MTFNFRGTGTSEGDFSLQGWVDDLRTAIDHLVARDASRREVVLIGTNTGGSIAICVAADDPRVRAAAAAQPRADFDDWADHPRRFLEHAREIGAIRTPGFPPSFDEWSRAFRRFRPIDAARRFAPRPLLVMHGDDDESVPTSDARQLAEAHGAAELSLLVGAGHRLRHDPRAIAVLLGWLDRVRAIDEATPVRPEGRRSAASGPGQGRIPVSRCSRITSAAKLVIVIIDDLRAVAAEHLRDVHAVLAGRGEPQPQIPVLPAVPQSSSR